jgi:subtilisin family serine protease
MRTLVLGIVIAACAALAQAADRAAEPAPSLAERQQQVLVLLRIPAAHFRADGNYASGYADAAGRAARRRTAAALARIHGLDMVTDWPLPILGLDCYVMGVPDERRADDVAGQLSRDPRVERAQAMNQFHALGHDDPLFSMQPAARQWQLADLHEAATGRGVRVAVVDSAVQLDHPDLSGQVESSQNLVAGRPYVAENHGTAVAGIIAARADNHIGIVGVAPQARLLALRACWQESTADSLCTTLSLALALHSAVERGAQVINLSLGGPSDRLVEQLIDVALARGIAVVAAADRTAPRGGFPAALNGVIAVVDDTAGATPSGAWIAPGRDVPTTLPASRWSTVSGASYAAAHVSGLLALMIDLHARSGRVGGPLAAELVALPDGRIDACASLTRAGAVCACACGAAASAQESIARR